MGIVRRVCGIMHLGFMKIGCINDKIELGVIIILIKKFYYIVRVQNSTVNAGRSMTNNFNIIIAAQLDRRKVGHIVTLIVFKF